MARRSKEDAEHTREQLLDAAECLFVQKGVAATSLDDIARAANLTRGAVYWHFTNKQELFDAMHERVKLPMDELFKQVANHPNPLWAMQDSCIASLKELGENESKRRVYTILLHKSEQMDDLKSCIRQHQMREECIAQLTNIFELAKKLRHLGYGVEPEQAAVALHAYMLGLFSDYLRNPEEYDHVTHSTTLIRIFFRGIAAQS